jgi:ubiquinone/menaquinone biosynthesis C-methylase UbiE
LRTLTPEEAKGFYDKFGSKQDAQSFYEEPALQTLIANAAFQDAQSVFEFGCGTGRFAVELLQHHLPATARYRGVDISTTMVGLAATRLAPFAPRAEIASSFHELTLPIPDASVDRFVATYVFDLLPISAQQRLISEVRRVLCPAGMLCLVGITDGTTWSSRVVMAVWQWLFARKPSWVGGCRPSRARGYIPSTEWIIRFRTVVVSWGVASEVVIALPVPQTAHA